MSFAVTQRMNSAPKLCVVVPVYNHSAHLPVLLDKLQAAGLPVVLVDDGSDADCHQLMADEAQAREQVDLVVHTHNQGKGAAVCSGLFHALQAGYSHALQVDADGQHDLSCLPQFIEAMHLSPEALVAGYPAYDDSVPRHRYLLRYLSHVWVWINTLSLEIIDSMCGFRIYPLKRSCELLRTERVGQRMDFDGEFIVRWLWRGYPLTQLQVRVTYPEDGISHFQPFNDNRLISWMHTRLFFGMLIRLPRLLARRWRKA